MPKKLVRLQVGYLDGEGTDVSDAVYDRPVMLVYTGTFDSMDGEVTITDEHIENLAAIHNAKHMSVLERIKGVIGAEAQVPMRECPPLQLDHDPKATHTIGRVVGVLTVGSVEIDGKLRKALFGTARFLGKENVEKAKDGRYTHVSIGASLTEKPTLNELSVTPFPAAPCASLLSGNTENKEGDASMHEKLKKHLMDKKKLSEKDADELAKKMSKHLSEKEGKSEEEMSKHLADADDEKMSKLSDEYDQAMSKLAAEQTEKERLAALSEDEKEKEEKDKEAKKLAARTSFTTLAKGLKTTSVELKKEVKLSAVNARLGRLRSSGKMTPAEIKGLDVEKLANLSSEAIEAAFAMAEARQPVIKFGLAHGTTKGEEIEKVAKRFRMARMELESRLNMPSKRAEAEKLLAQLKTEEKTALAAVGGQDEENPSKGMLTRVGYDDLCAMLDDKKRHEELKKHLKHLSEIHGEESSGGEGDDKRMSAVAKRQDELQNQLNELISIAAPAMGIKLEELN